jgi:hypothetical protein
MQGFLCFISDLFSNVKRRAAVRQRGSAATRQCGISKIHIRGN